jgi:sugar lactone lactonase YvrE
VLFSCHETYESSTEVAMTRRLLTLFFALLWAAQAFGQFSITTFAGSTAGGGSQDGALRVAKLESPAGVAADRLGNLYITDSGNLTVRRAGVDGQMTTIAGAVAIPGTADGPGSSARFTALTGIAVDASGNVYVSDGGARTIRKITPDGTVSTFAGVPNTGNTFSYVDGKGSAARFADPRGMACDAAGNVFLADGDRIRKITPDGTVSTIALGTPFNHPYDVAVDGAGNLFVVDTFDYTVRKITPDGNVTTIAGLLNTPGAADGVGAVARFGALISIVVDATGNLFTVDNDAGTLRRIAPDGTVTTVAGATNPYQYQDGIGNDASFAGPFGLALDRVSGSVFVADLPVNVIRRFDPTTAAVTTYAGSVPTAGLTDGPALQAVFNYPRVAVSDSLGNLFVSQNNAIRKITPGGVVSTFAGDASPGFADGTGTAARFLFPFGLAVDAHDNLYVADTANYVIRKITAAGVVTTVAGTAGQSGSVDATGANARFNYPTNLAIDANGNLFITDPYANTIRKMDPAGVVTTFAGTGQQGATDGPAATATFSLPYDLSFDSSGNLYVADLDNGAIRKIANGEVSTLTSSLDNPLSVAVAPDGRLYASDTGTIVRIEPGGAITTLAGVNRSNGNVDGVGTDARLGPGVSLRFDRTGRLVLADAFNQALRSAAFGKPRIRAFTASVSEVANPGDGATLQWSTTGPAVTIQGVAGTFGASGSIIVHPTVSTLYRLTVTGEGGAASALASVSVGHPPPRRAVAH